MPAERAWKRCREVYRDTLSEFSRHRLTVQAMAEGGDEIDHAVSRHSAQHGRQREETVVCTGKCYWNGTRAS